MPVFRDWKALAPSPGSTVGHWLVIGLPYRTEPPACQRWFLPCRCLCGKERHVRLAPLLDGKSKSCGCQSSLIHGHNRQQRPSPEYQTWSRMLRRCYNPNHDRYRFYGGRGITVAPEWHDFTAFLRDMGLKPFPKAVLDRIDSAGPYAPGNCRWTTQRENTNNTKRNVWLEFQGRRQTMSQWARELGLDPDLIQARLAEGWEVERALTAPIRHRPRRANREVTGPPASGVPPPASSVPKPLG
jgi:hypothetical protein